jgi:transcriptional regulator with XRE-family HTH domain
LSLREVARRVGVAHDTIARVERGESTVMTIDLIASIAAVLGLELATSLFPKGDPVRDRGHLALLERFRKRLPKEVPMRTEVPLPITGDLRSADAIVKTRDGDVLVEAETHLGDLQLIERRSAAKQRDIGAVHLVLLVADTRHNREVLQSIPALRERFPIGSRDCLRALARGAIPPDDAIVVL